MKLSIMMPVHNAGQYLARSISSIINQNFTDWELCVVDDGSSDNSVEVIKSFMEKDKRIKLLSREEKGYGITMNNLLDMCEGEYIGDVDPDDWIEPNMFEKMLAEIGDCDMLRAGFIYETPKGQFVEEFESTASFCPRELPLKQRVQFFTFQPAIWSQIYRADFIRNNNIRFHETPGAAFQDTAWLFQCNCHADSARVISGRLYHYNKMNENSSTAKKDYPFATSVEFRWMHEFLDNHLEYAEKCRPSLVKLQYGSYMWNLRRIRREDEEEFIKLVQEDLQNAWEYLDVRMLTNEEFNIYLLILNDPMDFLEQMRTNGAKTY